LVKCRSSGIGFSGLWDEFSDFFIQKPYRRLRWFNLWMKISQIQNPGFSNRGDLDGQRPLVWANRRWWGLFEAGGRFTAVELSGRGKGAPTGSERRIQATWGSTTHAGLAIWASGDSERRLYPYPSAATSCADFTTSSSRRKKVGVDARPHPGLLARSYN